jgi:hypothetical protein
MCRFPRTLCIIALAAAILPATILTAPRATAQALSEQQLYAIARDAYVYAYPIVIMDITKRQATSVPNATTASLRAPINQFAHVRTYPKADARDVVRMNFDTLYSAAWLDVTREPMILSVPDTGGRYYLLPMLDMWTDVFSVVGSRTTGTQAANFAVVAPNWNGKLPDGIHKIIAPTPTIWIIGRTQTNGPDDYENVRKVQDGYKLTPLSQWGRSFTPPNNAPVDAAVDTVTPPLTQMNRMDGVTVLNRLASLMQATPPHANDYPILFQLRQIGIEPGKPFDVSRLDPAQVRTINTAAKDALADLAQSTKAGIGTQVNGWFYALDTIGTYGTSYKRRAIISLAGLGANVPEDAVYPMTVVDGDGQPYIGAHRYVLHFEKDKLPPANAFWSVTLYDDNGFQVANSINRFAIGNHDKLAFNSDGSLDIYVQNGSPGAGKEANWLPAPKGTFNLTMRIYSPRRELMDGSWTPPPVRRAEESTVGRN